MNKQTANRFCSNYLILIIVYFYVKIHYVEIAQKRCNLNVLNTYTIILYICMKGIKNLCLTTLLKSFLITPISLTLIILTMWIQISFATSGQNMGPTGRSLLTTTFIRKIQVLINLTHFTNKKRDPKVPLLGWKCPRLKCKFTAD